MSSNYLYRDPAKAQRYNLAADRLHRYARGCGFRDMRVSHKYLYLLDLLWARPEQD